MTLLKNGLFPKLLLLPLLLPDDVAPNEKLPKLGRPEPDPRELEDTNVAGCGAAVGWNSLSAIVLLNTVADTGVVGPKPLTPKLPSKNWVEKAGVVGLKAGAKVVDDTGLGVTPNRVAVPDPNRKVPELTGWNPPNEGEDVTVGNGLPVAGPKLNET